MVYAPYFVTPYFEAFPYFALTLGCILHYVSVLHNLQNGFTFEAHSVVRIRILYSVFRF